MEILNVFGFVNCYIMMGVVCVYYEMILVVVEVLRGMYILIVVVFIGFLVGFLLFNLRLEEIK